MANYKLINVDNLQDLINELKEMNNNELRYIIEDLESLIKEAN